MGGVLHADPNILVALNNQTVGHMLGLVLGQVVVVGLMYLVNSRQQSLAISTSDSGSKK